LKITGVGHKIAIPSIIYLLLTIMVDRLHYPIFKFTPDNQTILIIIGVSLILIGIGLVIICAFFDILTNKFRKNNKSLNI